MSNYTENTRAYIDSVPLNKRRNLGQFMTPNWVGKEMANQFQPTTHKNTGEQTKIRVLDPAVGTGELLLAFIETHGTDKYEFHGWDVDEGMLETAKKNVPNLNIEKRSVFDPVGTHKNTFDYIIGNPPYFELKKNTPELAASTYELRNSKGRLNIYAFFFEYALTLLKNRGELIYLVPPSMNNGAYFKLLRKHIITNSIINEIKILPENNHFEEALTAVQIIHLTKNENQYKYNIKQSAPYVLDFTELTNVEGLPTIFTINKTEITKKWVNAQSLHQLGYRVYTGKTTWNTYKTVFVEQNNHSIPLIYSKDISSDNKLVLLPALENKRWLPADLPGVLNGEKILVNRIVGSLTNPNIKSALISGNSTTKFYCENHVNIIEPIPDITPEIPISELHEKLSKQNFSSYLQSLTGNTQLSARELEFLIPIRL